jgi:3-oxoacyl-[acyl-carrier protein] reductase
VEATPIQPDPSRSLEGKVAIVTGAGRGIGRAIALAYAAAGAAVACAARTRPQIEAAAAEIAAAGGRAIPVECDVTDHASVRSMVSRATDELGGLDIMMINAGGALDRNKIGEGDPAAWVGTVNLNLVGAYYCALEALPHLKARGAGKIIMMGSGMGHRGLAGNSSYAVAKAGLWMLTRVLAQEVMEHRISVNEIIPGPVLTDATRQEAAMRDPSRATAFGIAGEWIKQPDEVVPLALFLAAQPDIGPTAQSFSLLRRDW